MLHGDKHDSTIIRIPCVPSYLQRKEVTAPTAQVTFKYRTLNPNNFILCYEHFLIYLYYIACFSFFIFFRN